MPGRPDPDATWSSGRLEVTGGYLAFHRTGGPGPSLVLSHGLTDNGLCWFRLAAALAGDFDVIMLDARGHGESSRLSIDRPHDPGNDIAEAMDRLGLARAIMMGHSVGAQATADYASAHPTRVSKVVLEDPPWSPPIDPEALATRRDAFQRQMESFRCMPSAEIMAKGKASSPLWHDDDFPDWADAKRQVDPRAFPALAPWRPSMAAILAPTLVIHGDQTLGSLVSPEQAQDVRTINPNIATVAIERAGHNVRRENFADFLSAVRAFLID